VAAAAAPATAEPARSQQVSLWTIFLKFGTIGAISFGGGIIAYLQRMLIDETKWLTEDQFMASLEISQTMPGLNAVNMSVLVGDRLRGPLGAFVAALGIVAPGAIFVFLLGLAATEAHRDTPIANAALRGIAAGATGLLLAIALRTGHKSFARPRDIVFIALTFAAMSFLKLRLLLILLTLAPIAIYLYRPREKADA
jgi:chromate transporter